MFKLIILVSFLPSYCFATYSYDDFRGKTVTFMFAGEAIGRGPENPGEPDDGSFCFDNTLYDSGMNQVGTAVDCIQFNEVCGGCDVNANPHGVSMLNLATTIFNIQGSRLVFSGWVSARPLMVHDETSGGSYPNGRGFTHYTGSPAADPDYNTFHTDFNTGIFEGATGQNRLSGLIKVVDDQPTLEFDCIFVVMFDGAPVPRPPDAVCCDGDENACWNIQTEHTCIGRDCTWTCDSTSCCQGGDGCQTRGTGSVAREVCERTSRCSWVCGVGNSDRGSDVAQHLETLTGA